MPLRPEQILTGLGDQDTAKRLLEEALKDESLNLGQIGSDQSAGSWAETLLKQRILVEYPCHERFALDAVEHQNGDPDGDDTPLERYEAFYFQASLGMIPDSLNTKKIIRDLTDLNDKLDETLKEVNESDRADPIWCATRGGRGGIDSSTCTNEADRIDGDWRETGRGIHAIIDSLGGDHLRFFTRFGKYKNIGIFLRDDITLANEKALILGVLEWRKTIVAIGSAHQDISIGDVGTGVKTWKETLNKAQSEVVKYPHDLLKHIKD